MNISEFASNERLRILIKGESGCGKSIQAGSFPNVYFFDFDGRIRSVVEHYRKLGKTDIDFDHYRIDQLDKAQDKIEGWQRNGCPYQTVVIDTTTTLIDSCFNYIDKMKGSLAAAKGNKESFGMKVQLGFISVPALDDYKFLGNALKTIINNTKEIPNTHIIYCAHVMLKEKVNPDGSTIPMRMILAPGQASNIIPLHFDEIYHMDAEEPLNNKERSKRVILTESNSMDFARTSYANIPRTMDVTTKLLYQQLCDYIPGLKEQSETKKEIRKTNVKTL